MRIADVEYTVVVRGKPVGDAVSRREHHVTDVSAGVVTVTPEGAGQRGQLHVERPVKIGRAVVLGVVAGKNRGDGGQRPARLAVVVLEHDAAGREAVDDRAGIAAVAVVTEVVRP